MKIEKQGMVTLNGKDYPTYGYVLNLAHEQGLIGISTELVRLEIDKEKGSLLCISKATVTMEKDGITKIFQGYGDVTDRNVNKMILPHYVRMAETRAKGRALRDAVNIGQALIEELNEINN